MTPRWPVRPHLRRPPRRRLLANIPEGMELPPAFAEIDRQIAVFGQVDRATHCAGWGFDIVGWVSVEVAEELPWEGEA